MKTITLHVTGMTCDHCVQAVRRGLDRPGSARASGPWWVYMIECRGGSVYTGIAKDPASRYRAHVSGRGAAFTRINPPRRFLGTMPCGSLREALRQERALRRLPRAAKIAWAIGAAMRDDGNPPAGSCVPP